LNLKGREINLPVMPGSSELEGFSPPLDTLVDQDTSSVNAELQTPSKPTQYKPAQWGVHLSSRHSGSLAAGTHGKNWMPA
jgi:hypothetical protein